MKMRSIRALLFGFVLLALSAAAFGQIGVAVSFGPPPLPVQAMDISGRRGIGLMTMTPAIITGCLAPG